MKILTFSYIDKNPGACLQINGEIIATAFEKDYYVGNLVQVFPENSIWEVMNKGSITIEELDILAYKGKPFNSFECLIEKHLKFFPHSFFSFRKDVTEYLFPRFTLIKLVKEKLNYRKALCYINPHDALAFWKLTSKNKPSFIMTILSDISNFGTSCCYEIKTGDLFLMKQLSFPNVFHLLHEPEQNTSAKQVIKIHELISLNNDGSFTIDKKYFDLGDSELRLKKISFPRSSFCSFCVEMLSRIIKGCRINDGQTGCVLSDMETDPIVIRSLKEKFPKLSFVIIDENESLIKTSEYIARFILED